MNTTKIVKKDKNKNKAKDLSYIKYYTYKQKDYYAKKMLTSQKTSISLGHLYVDD